MPFEADLVQSGAALDGRVREPNSFAPGGAAELVAEIAGMVMGGEVRFTKRYENADSGGDPDYAGRLDASGRRITGTWTFAEAPEFRGEFTMVRKPKAAAKAERRESVEAQR